MKKLLVLFMTLALVFGCKQEILIPEFEQGKDGKMVIFDFAPLGPTDAYNNGGVQFMLGYDENDNGELDDDEVLASAPIWNGNNGADGASGINGINGIDGTNGLKGADGADGSDGSDGNDGTDGHSPYIENGFWYTWNIENNKYENTFVESTGTDGKDGVDGKDGITPNIYYLIMPIEHTDHPNGGNLVTIIWDKNHNELIDDNEFIGAYTVWNGNDGTDGVDGDKGDRGSIVNIVITTANECVGVSGYRVQFVLDGVPNPNDWFEVCDGKVGAKGNDGNNSLITFTEEDGCVIIESWLDINNDNSVDENIDELIDVVVICACSLSDCDDCDEDWEAICHKGIKTLWLPESAIEAHLRAHTEDFLGECDDN